MASAAYTGQAQQTTAGLVGAMSADTSWCPAVSTCVTPSVDTIQQISTTASVTDWGSLVEIGATPLTANITITLPTAASAVGKAITFKRLDATAFTVTLAPFAGELGEVTTPTGLNTQYGALTVEAVSTTKYEQVSNISTATAVAPTTNTLTATGAAITSTVDGVVATVTPATGTIQDTLGFNAAGALVKAVVAVTPATTNTLTATGAALTSTVDGVAATVTPAAGTIQDTLGFNAAGALVKAVVAVTPATTNTLTAVGSAITSTVDGVAATVTPAAGTIANTLGFSAAGALVKAAVVATTNTLSATGSALTSTVDGVVAVVTPAVGNIQNTLGFDATGALVKAVVPTTGILVVDGTQTNNRIQNLGTFSQTWNNVGGFTKNIITGSETSNFTDTFTPSTAQTVASPSGHSLTAASGMGRTTTASVTPTSAYMEVSAGGTNKASVVVQDGAVGAAAGVPQVFAKTHAVSAGTATAGQVLTLSATTGESEFATIPPSSDTIQTAATTGTTVIAAWSSVVLIPTLIGNITLTYPTPVGSLGKVIKVVQSGVPNAFTITHTPLVGTITFTNAAGELAAAGGAVTVEAMTAVSIQQVSSAAASLTSVALTYGRVAASADLPATSFTIASPGTKVPFNSTVYNSGVTFSGTDSIIPSQAGRYRVSWFMMAGSSDMQADGTFHVVQNGVSLGNIFVDMMQAAGVNQVSSFLDVNLVAGQAVELRYQPSAADTVPWGRGSYLDVTQLPSAVAPLVVSGISTNDQTASGYFDVGTMRIQWGSHNDGNVDTTTVTMPAAFANTNYIVNCTSNNGIAGSASAEAKTTTTFDIDRASTTVALNIWGWICIGLKP